RAASSHSTTRAIRASARTGSWTSCSLRAAGSAPGRPIRWRSSAALSALVLDQQPERPTREPRVRGVEEVEQRHAWVAEHRSQLAELEEALAPVVVPHAARTDAAERHVVLRDVQHAVVDRDAARDGRVEELVLL